MKIMRRVLAWVRPIRKPTEPTNPEECCSSPVSEATRTAWEAVDSILTNIEKDEEDGTT